MIASTLERVANADREHKRCIGKHTQYAFKLSTGAVARLGRLREERGETRPNEFRRLAWLLARDARPRFAVTGDGLRYTLHVPMSAEQYAGLVIVAARFGVPKDAIGEMVMSYYPEEAA